HRIMCYNVRNCRGMDDVLDYDRVARVMKTVGAEVVAVQELDSATRRSKGTVALSELATRLKMNATYAPAIDYDGGKYGVGLLSKEKPISYTTMPLPGAKERRVLLLVEFKDYYFAVTHLSLTNEERVQSVNMIIDRFKNITNKPLFIAGDFNATPKSDPIKLMSGKFTVLSDTNAFTIPVVKPNRTIDFIFGYNNGYSFDVTQRKVLDEQNASDHLPLFVDVVIKK
ncbi:MAG: endonuclease/exonuclease/phosphatase family protein, partial [Rikenellaceae bacterium]